MARNLLKALRPRWSSPGRTICRPRLQLEALEDRVTPAVSSVHFAVIGDYGTGEQPEQDVANLVHSWNPDFVATTCDNNYSTPPMTTASYDTMVGKYYHDFIYPYSGSYGAGATSNRFWPTMGDHDWGYDPNGDQAYLSFFKGLPGNRRYYTVTQGPVALFILDTYQSEPDGTSSISTQAQWLQGALASSTAPWKLVFLSDPPYSSGPFGSIGGVEWPFQAWGASAVFSGHDHGYERLFENGIPYFVDGAGGAGLDSPPTSLIAGSQAHANVFGAMKVDASPSQITFSFSNTAGTVLDTYTMNYVLPAAPTSLIATAVSGTQINLTWTDNSTNETGYAIERSSDGMNFAQIATAGPATTSYLDSGLGSGSPYYYLVAAYNAGGNSAYSNTGTATIPSQTQPTGAPTNLTAAVASASQVNLTWTDNSGGLYSFQIERSTDGSSYSLVATVGMGVTSYADTGLASATYYYQVVGMTTQGGNGGASAVVGAVLAPAAPGNLGATAVSGTQINLKWTNNASNATGINVLRSTDGTNFTQIATAGPATANYLDSGLSAGTTYYYRVATYNTGGNSTYSNTASTTIPSSLMAPVGAPTNLTTAVASASKVNLTWTDNSAGLDSFQIKRSTDGSTYSLVATVGMGVTSYADTGLAPATYYYQVVGIMALGGNGGATAVVGAVLAPAAPGSLSATVVSGTQINLKWTNNAVNAAGINILRSTDGTSFTQIATASPAVANYLDSGLSSGTTYSYRVTASNVSGSSAYSNTGSATIQGSSVLPPTNLSATVASGSQVNLAWTDNSGGIYSFKIERSTDGSNYTLIATTVIGATSYADTGLAAATYYYQVVATTNQSDNKGSTAIASAVLAPAAPGNLTATAFFSHQINLSWKNNASNATALNILRSTDGVNFTTIATVGVCTTTFPDYFLTPSTTYYYRVGAVNASGAASSATVSATTSPPTPPRAASNLIATAVDAYSIKLSWTDNSNAPNVEEDGFAMYVSTNGVNFNWTQTPGRDVTTYTDPDGLSPRTKYYYRIVAFNVDGWAAPSNTASATTLAGDSRQLPAMAQSGAADVSYHGGPLLQQVQVESVYAGQAWSSDAGLQQQMQQLDGFLNYFVASPYVAALQQYHVSSGTFLGHDVVAQNPPGGQTIDDSQIRALLDAEIAANHVAAPSADRLYVFFTAPGVVVTADGQNSVTDFAGYHDVFTDSSGATVYYAVVPYPLGNISPAPLSPVQQETVVLSHEVSEAITDPDTHSGWFDPRLGEIGDITAGQIGMLHGYAVQALWSQVDGKAVMPTSTRGTVEPIASAPVPASAGPLRSLGTTWPGANANTVLATFMALFPGDSYPRFSQATGSQDPPALPAGQSPGLGAAIASTIPVAVPSVATTTVVVIPPAFPWATSLRPVQDARYDSGGDDNLQEILEDELPAAGCAVPREEVFPPAAVSGFEQEVLPANQSAAALWTEASTAYFALQGTAGGPAERGIPATLSLAVRDSSAGRPGAAAAALMLGLASYQNLPSGEPPVRERSSLARKHGSPETT